MVDVGIVELNKENITPHVLGRSLGYLESVFGEESARASVHATRPQESTSDWDPLAREIQLIEEQTSRVPFVGTELHAAPLIEACLKKYETWELYKNDMRYIRLWLDYGSLSQAPQRVFEYMEWHRIGKFSAKFYEQWANLYETQKRTREALKVLERGIASGAQPLAVIESTKAQLLVRSPMSPEVPRKRVSGHIPGSKRLKVYVDGEESDSDSSASNEVPTARAFPYVAREDTENKQPVNDLQGQMILQTLSGSRPPKPALQVFRDDSESETEETKESPCVPPSFAKLDSVRLMEIRCFAEPVREFDPTPRPLFVAKPPESDVLTGVLHNIDATMARVLYERHDGHTERIPDLFAEGPPTEQL